VADNTQCGIVVAATGCEIIGNNCNGGESDDPGIYIEGSYNRIEDNHVTTALTGIEIPGTSYTKNIIIKNSVINTTPEDALDYVYPSGTVVGPFITNPATITSSNPWANFEF
jgi:nitrous oxidase accessory protein NosD